MISQILKQILKPNKSKIIMFSIISIIFILEYHPIGGVQYMGLIFRMIFEIIPIDVLIVINQAMLLIFIILTVFGYVAELSAIVAYLFALIFLSLFGSNFEMLGLISGYIIITIYGYILSCSMYSLFDTMKKRLIH